MRPCKNYTTYSSLLCKKYNLWSNLRCYVRVTCFFRNDGDCGLSVSINLKDQSHREIIAFLYAKDKPVVCVSPKGPRTRPVTYYAVLLYPTLKHIGHSFTDESTCYRGLDLHSTTYSRHCGISSASQLTQANQECLFVPLTLAYGQLMLMLDHCNSSLHEINSDVVHELLAKVQQLGDIVYSICKPQSFVISEVEPLCISQNLLADLKYGHCRDDDDDDLVKMESWFENSENLLNQLAAEKQRSWNTLQSCALQLILRRSILQSFGVADLAKICASVAFSVKHLLRTIQHIEEADSLVKSMESRREMLRRDNRNPQQTNYALM